MTVSTKTLPNGTVGQSYAATLIPGGGTAPYTWSIVSGALPAGLVLAASSGRISGTPTAAQSGASVSFQVADSSSPAEKATVSIGLTIAVAPADIAVSLSPARAAIVVGQRLSLAATTNDAAGVTWKSAPSGGSLSVTAGTSGLSATFTASAAGVYTITAQSVTNPAASSSLAAGVTDLQGVYTNHDDLARDGLNDHEYVLTPANVATSSFGKLFSCGVDGAIYAQPLWVANLEVNGAAHNVVLVATAHDGLFAFDADASPCATLWSVSLIDGAHGGSSGEIAVPSGRTGGLVCTRLGDITPEVGVIGTPVIDPLTRTLYVVSKSVDSDETTFHQRLHAIDLATGAEKPGSPITIAATYAGSGDGGTTVTFDPRQEDQRASLSLVNGTVYIAWASHEDTPPFYGWLLGYSYNGSSFTQTHAFNVAPNAGYAGIWMDGSAPAADGNGQLYVITGNGAFDATSSTAPNNDYGDSLLQLSSTLGVLQYFTPSEEQQEEADDNDFGSGGVVLADLAPGGAATHLAFGGSKNGFLYVLDRDALGGFGDGKALQRIDPGGEIFATGAYWNQSFYIAPVAAPLLAYHLDLSTDTLSATSSSSGTFGFPGATPAISATGTSNGIVWALDDSEYCTPHGGHVPPCGPAVLHAYDATNLAHELWNSAMESADAAGNAVKFTVPTVANGKVYIGTRGNNTGGSDGSTSTPGELDVYGFAEK
ncbi:MAG: putative Ig domain-containing protein [Steroidobacteraceae bacterium]